MDPIRVVGTMEGQQMARLNINHLYFLNNKLNAYHNENETIMYVTADSVYVCSACEKSEKLSAPSGLQGQQMGSTVVLAWNRVDGAVRYVIERDGIFLMTQTSTTYTDHNPSNGYNSYEVYAENEYSKSQSAYVNVFFDGASSGGNGGGSSNPDNNNGYLDYTNQNISGIWKATWNKQMQLNENYFTFDINGNVQGVEIGSDYAFIYTGRYKFQGENLVITYSKYEYYANGKVQSTISMNKQYTYQMRGILNTGWMGWKTGEYDEISLYPSPSISWPSNISTSTYQSVVGTWERTDITYSSDVEYIYLGGDGVYKNVYKVNANTIVRMGKWSATSSAITVNLIDGAEISGGLLLSHKYLGWTDNLEIVSVSSNQLKIKNGGFTQTYKKVSSIGITY